MAGRAQTAGAVEPVQDTQIRNAAPEKQNPFGDKRRRIDYSTRKSDELRWAARTAETAQFMPAEQQQGAELPALLPSEQDNV